jgi:hypothetical protein
MTSKRPPSSSIPAKSNRASRSGRASASNPPDLNSELNNASQLADQISGYRVRKSGGTTGLATPSHPSPGQKASRLSSPDIAEDGPTQPSWLGRFPLHRWLLNWKLLLAIAVMTCGGSLAFSLAVLLRLPGTPNCPAIFWPMASASIRFECARLAASKATIKDLQEAITLVDSLPADHPMRGEADRLIEQWSTELLELAEEVFQEGKLTEAIGAAKKIPAKSTAAQLVEKQIARWNKIWGKGEDLYRKAEEELRKENFRAAFSYAVRLTDLDNKFWQTIKYEELSGRITAAKEDSQKLAKALRLMEDGGEQNLLEAMKLALGIPPQSYVYKSAQDTVNKVAKKILDLAESKLEQRNLDAAMKLLDNIPDRANVKEDARDLAVLANAMSQSWQNSVASIEDAISQAQRIGQNRPLYKKAQQLISRWQKEIEAIAQLEKARSIAASGSTESLSEAISQAAQVQQSNPRWQEAQKEIGTWTKDIQTRQDRPTLDQAEQLAASGDISGLQAAINTASRIGSGRALSGEAQEKIARWTEQIQRIQDQPILDRARALADAGDLPGAVATAQSISSGRVLSRDAQDIIRNAQQQQKSQQVEVSAQSTLDQARRSAATGTVDSLLEGIAAANQISSSSSLRADADAAISEWSYQILRAAESRAVYDLAGAIAIARRIPSYSSAYSEAQQQIQTWLQQSRPPAAASPTSSAPPAEQ